MQHVDRAGLRLEQRRFENTHEEDFQPMARNKYTVSALLTLGLVAMACGDDSVSSDASASDASSDVSVDTSERRDAGPVDCANVEPAGFTLCEASRDTCSLIFDDSTGCQAACARIGLECESSYDLITDMCDEPLTMPLDCTESGHESDYCVCGRAPQPDAGPVDGGPATSDGGPFSDSGPGPDVNVGGPLKAFPSAYGAGSDTTGGRGLPVFFVTNLDNDGAGSFRQAVVDADNNGGGNVVFRVSGVVNLTGNLGFGGVENVSIWGQSAPEGGITVGNRLTGFYAGQSQTVPSSNIIIRFMRFRVDSAAALPIETDVFVMEWANNYIIDHCSFSFGTDEAINHGNGENVTWQHNLIGESSKGMIMGQVALQQGNFSFNSNVFYGVSHRFVNIESGGRVDMMNNLVWSWRSRIAVPRGGFQLNQIANFYENHPDDGPPDLSWRGMNYILNEGYPSPSIYAAANIVTNALTDSAASNYPAMWFQRGDFGVSQPRLPAEWEVSEPYAQLGHAFVIESAADVKANLPNNAGANRRLDGSGNVLDGTDTLDAMYINNINSNVHTPWQLQDTFFNDIENSAHYNAFFASVTGTPINTHPADYDTDDDGMPDEWERATFGDLSSNGQTDADGDGYSDLEEYMHLVD